MILRKVCRVFKKYVGQQLLAVYELVRFLLANKRQTMRCDWLAVVNIMAAECTDASCVNHTNYTSPLYLGIIHDCTQTVFGRLLFRLQAIKQITAAATSLSSAESAVSATLLSNKMSCVTQHLLVVCLRLYMFHFITRPSYMPHYRLACTSVRPSVCPSRT